MTEGGTLATFPPQLPFEGGASARPVLAVRDLVKHFKIGGILPGQAKVVRAVDGVTFDIGRAETLSLVGESGCGKSTIGRTVLRLTEPTSGEITLLGHRIDGMTMANMRPLRRHIQVVFQDPFSSLNPRLSVRDTLAEPMRNFGIAQSSADVERRVAELLDLVRLPQDAGSRKPHEFSGGQRQRIAIARALAAKPDLIVCDEAVSALDVSVKAQIVNLLQDLQRDLKLTLLFISHDLAIVEHMTHRVAVMYLGKIVEIAPKRAIFAKPRHPYTQALLSAIPVPDPTAKRERIILKGDVPSPINPPSGCRFRTRCPFAFDRCTTEEPALAYAGDGHLAACHLLDQGPGPRPGAGGARAA